MRFGYSPGWVDRSPTGLSPTAEWIVTSGVMPQYREYLRTRGISSAAPFYSPSAPVTTEDEIRMLEEQAKAIESQLDAIRRRLEQLKKIREGKPSA